MRPIARALLLIAICTPAFGWGKKGHEIVNRLALQALPDALKPFYLKHEKQVVSKAMEADEAKRKTGCEDVFHFIDLDQFGDPKNYPRSIDDGVKKYGLETFTRSGLLPWRVRDVFDQLVAAWKAKDASKVIELSAWLGHYAGDAHVPLHACANFDGQFTGQDGIHSRFENEMLDAYDLEKAALPLVGQATEVRDPFEATFAIALDSLSHVEMLLKVDAEATSKDPLLRPGPDGKRLKKRSEAYYKEMHEKLHVMTEQRLAKAATWAASLWYTAWLKADKPVIE